MALSTKSRVDEALALWNIHVMSVMSVMSDEHV